MTVIPSSSSRQFTSAGRRGGDDSTGVARYYETLRAHVKLIVLCMVVTLIAAVAYVELAPKSYTATAQMLVNTLPAQDSVLETVPGLLHASGDPTTDILTAAALVHTTQIAQATASALSSKQSATGILSKISVVPTDQSNILSVSTSSSSPQKAQRLVNAYARAVVAVRTANLHAYIAGEIPRLKASLSRLSPAAAAATTSGDLLGQLEALQNGSDSTVTLSGPASVPSAPTSPKKTLSLVAGVLIGLLIGVAGAFGMDTVDPPVRREGELRERFGAAPVLARIPTRAGPARPGPLVPMDLSFDALEQYRTLRATLPARLPSDDGVAYLVSSASPSEGKSTSAISLAAVLAQGGADVILIDADLRRPTVGVALDARSRKGKGTEGVLSGNVALADALQPVTLGSTRFRVLAAHGHAVKQADQLTPSGAQRLVEAAEKLADIVVIDSPPLTAVSDALPFARVVDQVLIVVRMGQTKLSRLSETWELLSHQHTQPSGIILIGVRGHGGPMYGYGYDDDQSSWLTETHSRTEPAGVRSSRSRRS